MKACVKDYSEAERIDKLCKKLLNNKKFQEDSAKEKLNKCDSFDIYNLAEKYNIY